MEKISVLHANDPFVAALYTAITEAIKDRCVAAPNGITYASIIGTLELVKQDLIDEMKDL